MGRGSETQLQVAENLNKLTQQDKGKGSYLPLWKVADTTLWYQGNDSISSMYFIPTLYLTFPILSHISWEEKINNQVDADTLGGVAQNLYG